MLIGQVTGERRYVEAARRVADCVLGLVELGWTRPEPGPRNSGWPLIALAAVHQATGDDRYVEAMRTGREVRAVGAVARRALADAARAHEDYCAWQNAVLLIGLSRYLAVEEQEDVRQAFMAGSRAMLDLGRNRDGTFVYLQRFDYRWANRSAFVREALALAYDTTGDDQYLRAGLQGGHRWYRPRSLSPALSNDIAEWRGHLPFLARAHDAGLLPDLGDA